MERESQQSQILWLQIRDETMAKTYGIVLSWIKYKESSKIATILTQDLGKISVMAQGALKPKSQLLAVTEAFSISHFELKKGKNFYYIESAELENSHYGLRGDMNRLAFGFYALELVDRSIPEGEPSPKIYGMLEKLLNELSSTNTPIIPLVAFEIKMISILGYRPQLSACVHCGATNSHGWEYNIYDGGIVCFACSKGLGTSIDSETAAIMRTLLFSRFEELKSLNIDQVKLERIHSIMYQYILHTLDIKELKSDTMLKRLSIAEKGQS